MKQVGLEINLHYLILQVGNKIRTIVMVFKRVGTLTVDFELILPLSRTCIIGSGAHILSTVKW